MLVNEIDKYTLQTDSQRHKRNSAKQLSLVISDRRVIVIRQQQYIGISSLDNNPRLRNNAAKLTVSIPVLVRPRKRVLRIVLANDGQTIG